MSDEERYVVKAQEVHFAQPDRSYMGTPAQQRNKRDFLLHLWAGNTPQEAADKASTSMQAITHWRKRDQQFDADVEATLQNLRETYLYAIEQNMFQQAMKDEVAAGSLGLRINQILNPVYSKDKGKQEERKAVAEKSTINEWMDTPVILDADFRETDDDDDA